MPQRLIPAAESFADLRFPVAGIDLSQAFSQQQYKPVANGEYAPTTPSGINVRGYEPGTNRARGAQRPGLTKYFASPVVADWIIQELNLLVRKGAAVQLNQAGRIVSVVAVSQGQVYSAQPGDTAWTAATNSTGNNPPLNYSGVVFSTALNQKMWFADGNNYVYFDPSTNQVLRWGATAGQLPVDSQNNCPRLICTWRGRMALSGLILDPQNIFFSAVNDPTNFDYSPLSESPTQALALNLAPQGLIGDVVTGLCPYTDDILLVFGDHTLYMLRGDPMAGGQIDLISDSIGGAFGLPWCKDPYGTCYFFSNRCGIYSLVPGNAPLRISQQIEQLIQPIDTGTNSIRLIWDDRYQGLHVFITPLAAPAATTHFFYEQRSGAWWEDSFGNHNHDPIACCVFDGNTLGDRIALIGSWDGYVRNFSNTATNDDGTTIASSVVLGPLLTKDLDDVLLKDLQAVLGAASGSVSYAVYVGPTAEVALGSAPVATGTWTAGRVLNTPIRRSGHAIYVKLSATNPWAMEQIRARIAGEGKVRRRGY